VGNSKDGPTRYFCACLLDILDSNSFTDTFEFYLFSVSRHQNVRGSGGIRRQRPRFCDRFRAKSFRTDAKNDLNDQANEKRACWRVLLRRCRYQGRHRLVIETAARIVSKVAWANRPMLRASKSSGLFRRDCRGK